MSAAVEASSVGVRETRAERWQVIRAFWVWCLDRECRAFGAYWYFLCAAVIAGTWISSILITRRIPVGGAGAEIADALLVIAAGIVILGGSGRAAQAVCWEVSRELRDLVRLTGLGAGTLLWCKLLARWGAVGLQILGLSPFLAFAVTQGGVAWGQLLSGGAWLLMLAALMAGFAAMASVSSAEADNAATTASAAAFFLMFLYHLVFWFTAAGINIACVLLWDQSIGRFRGSFLAAVFDWSLMAAPVATGYRLASAPGSFSVFDSTYWIHFVTAACCLRMAHVVMVNRMHRSPEIEIAQNPGCLEGPAAVAVFRPRCTDHPLFWKDAYILGGGTSSQRMADVVWCLLAVGAVVLAVQQTDPTPRLATALVAECLAPILFALRFDNLLAADFRQEMWPSLMLLPIDPRRVVLAKTQAVLWEHRLIWLPVTVFVLFGMAHNPVVVLVAGAFAALAGVILCEMALLHRIVSQTWWLGPLQMFVLVGLMIVIFGVWLSAEPAVSVLITIGLLLCYIVPAAWWISYLLTNWSER